MRAKIKIFLCGVFWTVQNTEASFTREQTKNLEAVFSLAEWATATLMVCSLTMRASK